MPLPMFQAAAIAFFAGVALTVAVVVVVRIARGSRDLGTEGERATFQTLHLASKAAAQLRGGIIPGSSERALRYLRELLGADFVAIVTDSGEIVSDGIHRIDAATLSRSADRVFDTRRRTLADTITTSDSDGLSAVAAPIYSGETIVAVIIAVAPHVRAPLIRATEEVAAWCGSQLELGELDASRTALAEAQVKALRAQISPHFIYNALNAIASFITTDPARARDLVLEFADFTRYSFRRTGDFTTLAEELSSIRAYLSLEQARFGNRLSVVLTIAPETLATVIPFLSLQPLVENAVRHGLESQVDGGTITITSSDSGTHTEIVVEDDGSGASPEDLMKLINSGEGSDHVGVRNVDTRLRQFYGDDGGLIIETNIGLGTLVRMRVPKSQPLNSVSKGAS